MYFVNTKEDELGSLPSSSIYSFLIFANPLGLIFNAGTVAKTVQSAVFI